MRATRVNVNAIGAYIRKNRRLRHISLSASPRIIRSSLPTDYVAAYPQLIAAYVKAPFIALGTDGFGRSDTRSALRRFFEVDRHQIVVAALPRACE